MLPNIFVSRQLLPKIGNKQSLEKFARSGSKNETAVWQIYLITRDWYRPYRRFNLYVISRKLQRNILYHLDKAIIYAEWSINFPPLCVFSFIGSNLVWVTHWVWANVTPCRKYSVWNCFWTLFKDFFKRLKGVIHMYAQIQNKPILLEVNFTKRLFQWAKWHQKKFRSQNVTIRYVLLQLAIFMSV